MVNMWSLGLLILAGTLSASQVERIQGGEPTTIENYPAAIQLEILSFDDNIWYRICGGSILTSRYVMSAAHCLIMRNPNWVRVRAGATYHQTGGVLHYAETFYTHEDYGIESRFDADIAVLKLKTPLTYSSGIQQAIIPVQGSEIPDNLPVVKIGWGSLMQNGPPSEVLRDATVFIVNREVCARQYLGLPNRLQVTENMFCSGLFRVGGVDACQGDSGGPVYFGNITVGIISWGESCGHPSYPGVSTRVASYTDWIISKVV